MKTTLQDQAFVTEQAIGIGHRQPHINLLKAIERAKNRIVSEFRATRQLHQNLFKQALNEAEDLAWQTEYPHLVFPWLAVEKVQAIADWQTPQQSRHESRGVFAEAA